MPRIDRVLHHGEAVLDQVLPEAGIRLVRRLGIGRQIEHRNHPHGAPSPGDLWNRPRLRHASTLPLFGKRVRAEWQAGGKHKLPLAARQGPA